MNCTPCEGKTRLHVLMVLKTTWCHEEMHLNFCLWILIKTSPQRPTGAEPLWEERRPTHAGMLVHHWSPGLVPDVPVFPHQSHSCATPDSASVVGGGGSAAAPSVFTLFPEWACTEPAKLSLANTHSPRAPHPAEDESLGRWIGYLTTDHVKHTGRFKIQDFGPDEFTCRVHEAAGRRMFTIFVQNEWEETCTQH